MTTLYYIPDVQLPESQDFNDLMSEGRSFIQSHIGNEWTNLNASDPGVTILEQLCYALTELGYCIDFPMRDILTRKDGELETKDQFYFPEDILTTSPVTPDDYRKYLIDGVSNTGNAVVVQADGAYPVFLRNCMVYLMPVKTVSGVLAEAFCKSAFYYLNRNRYLATVFSQPEILADNAYYLQGTITISDGSGKSKILALVEESIRNYIFPTVIPASYATLTADSVATNDIFNGPHLENGWIPSSSLGVNRTQLWASELYSVIKSVSGVTEVNALGFVPVSTSQATGSTSSESTDQITSSLSELIVIKVKDSGFIIVESPQPSKQTTPDPLLVAAETIEAEFDLNILPESTVDIRDDIPKGTYRDINNYYSIQNTFPEIFAVGPDSITANATDYQIAQSRQLKGYLTLFDQVLANQFTQLACVPRLFSFKNSMTAAPFDRRTYFEKKTSSERRQEKFPAPYLRFSPTYFCQSLYDIPNIKPLLKDNDTFDFSFGEEPQKVQERESWERYMLDPYNPYMHGLMKFMESDSTSYERRNAILDHLLARHGESPYVINMLIANSVYAGETMKDRVVFKSMYLQNLGLLTYNRAKGYNFLGADTLIRKDEQDISPPWKIPVPAHFEELIFTGETVDSVFNSRRANWEEKLDEQDFINYSGIELKLSLLFGMKATYDDLLTAVLLNDDADQTKNFPQPVEDGLSMSLWFITRRRGFIFLETLLLLQNFEYQVTLCTQQKTAGTWQCYNVSGTETYDAVKLIIRTLIVQDNATLSGWVSDGKFSTCGMTFSITSGEDTNHYGQQIPGTDFSIVVTSLPLQQITLCTQQKTEGTWYCYNISGPQTAATVQLVTATLQSAGNSMIAGWISAGEMTAGDITYPISPAPDTGQYGEPVTGTHYNLLVTNDASPDASLALNYSCFDDDLQLIFPDYIPQFAEPSFRLMTQLFMENELPEELSYGFYLAGFTSLQPLVTNFIYWHESLRYKSSYAANSAVYAKGVLSAVNSLITPVPNAAN